jgi:hypothetical protein
MKEYQIDCQKFCGYIKVDDNNVLIETMPIVQKFIGQPLSNLTTWVKKKFGYCTLKEINKEK